MPTLAVGMMESLENRNMSTASVGMAPKNWNAVFFNGLLEFLERIENPILVAEEFEGQQPVRSAPNGFGKCLRHRSGCLLLAEIFK